jgi:hypothetical protein
MVWCRELIVEIKLLRALVLSWQPTRERSERGPHSPSYHPWYIQGLPHTLQYHCNVVRMDTECQDAPLLSPLPDSVDSIKVFPFIVHLKRDVIVSRQRQLGSLFSLKPSFPALVWRCRETWVRVPIS